MQNTYDTLTAFPARRLDGDNVIWSEDQPGVFHSSHLITSKMTNEGDTEYGPATGKQARVQTIADCLCKDNRVIEEWLVRDNGALCQQLGFSLTETAKQLTAQDIASGSLLTDKLQAARASVTGSDVEMIGAASKIAAAGLKAIWRDKNLDALADHYDFRVQSKYPASREGYGYDQLAAMMAPILSAFPDAVLSIDHVAETPYLGDAIDVALRWTVRATHSGEGAYGYPSGAEVFILAVSHFRVMNGRIREETTIWDDLALHRQIENARQRG
ncbi:MAG: ester cyclase [Parvularculaceae bacterium]|nr:ester cyclase [Parvularculaceae bacterium]